MFTPEYLALSLMISILSGFIGALLGLGGGIFLVPMLVYLLNVPIHLAAGASILAVIATSSAAAASYVEEELTNIKLGMFLELATTLGAVSGALIAFTTNENILEILFGVSLLYSSAFMYFQQRSIKGIWTAKNSDHIGQRLHLDGSYYDKALNQKVIYGVTKSPQIFALSYVAGVVSGLLGIGGGAIKVPAMNVIGGVPMKASVATSNFMVGVTAAASAMVYLRHGYCDAFIAGPVVLGTLIGATMSAKLTNRISGSTIKHLFILILTIIGIRMILTGLGIW